MAKMEGFMFMAALVSLGLSALMYILHVSLVGKRQAAAMAGVGGNPPQHMSAGVQLWGTGRFATMLKVNGLIFLTLSVLSRAMATGHGPFSNMYEFSIVLAWGIVAASLYFQWRYQTPFISAIAVPMAVGFLIYAYSLPARAVPLVPALQQSLLLTFHVAVAMIAYGVFGIGFAAGILYLVQHYGRISWLPSADTLDDIGYRAVMIGFPFMTLTIVLGALWADIAWGRYWGWDPKETASLVTWLIYGAYLHARTLRGWRGTRSSALLVLGFLAVVFTYMGNYFFSGLHAYA